MEFGSSGGTRTTDLTVRLDERPDQGRTRRGRLTFCVTGARRSNDLDVKGLPPHSSAKFSSTGESGSCITVTVRTRTRTLPGDYRLTVTDRRSRPPRGATLTFARTGTAGD